MTIRDSRHYEERRPEHWPPYYEVEFLANTAISGSGRDAHRANIQLLKLHRNCMRDVESIRRANSTIEQLRTLT